MYNCTNASNSTALAVALAINPFYSTSFIATLDKILCLLST